MKYIVWHNFGALELWDSLPKTRTTSMYAVMYGKDTSHRVFQTDGAELRPVSDKPNQFPPSSWWRRILTQFYNPRIRIPVTYRAHGSIELDELKKILLRGVRNDEDLLTQWFELKDIKRILDKTESFSELLDAVRAMSGECETDAKLKRKIEQMGISFDEE